MGLGFWRDKVVRVFWFSKYTGSFVVRYVGVWFFFFRCLLFVLGLVLGVKVVWSLDNYSIFFIKSGR